MKKSKLLGLIFVIFALCHYSMASADVESITISPKSKTIGVGENLMYSVTYNDDGLQCYGITSYTSSDESIAKFIDNEQHRSRIVGHKPGTVTITANYCGKTDTATLTVVDDYTTLYVGQSADNIVTLPSSNCVDKVDENGLVTACAACNCVMRTEDGRTVVTLYSSSDKSIAVVDEATGRVTAIKPGTVTITANTCCNGSSYRVLKVVGNASHNPQTGSVMFILTLIFVPLSIIFALVAFLRIRKM